MVELAGPYFMAATLLVISGVTKLVEPGGIARALYSLGVPATMSTGRIIGGFEVLVGGAALGLGGRAAAAAVALTYLAFTGFIGLALRSEEVKSCGCFGARDAPPSQLHLAVDLAAAAVAVVLVVRPIDHIVAVMAETPWGGIPLLVLVVIGARLAALALTLVPRLVGEARA